ncbi:hypothetical protein D9613_008447 [Agrocybe pediades]|uniref:Uncharacterized protein n=1 Tax=Agrocybe pediades TaxID=84607 RepID=A0A8H4VQ66_9AGAR|nr:hypothetical protein D9613_008447 [Agrocybe pediades]
MAQARRYRETSFAHFRELGYQPEKIQWKGRVPMSGLAPVKRKAFIVSEYDPDRWPHDSSYVPNDKTRKREVKEKFALNDDDVADLCYVQRKFPPPNRLIAHEYLTVEVERRAWEKFGGPAGLDAALQERASKSVNRRGAAGKPARRGRPRANTTTQAAVSRGSVGAPPPRRYMSPSMDPAYWDMLDDMFGASLANAYGDNEDPFAGAYAHTVLGGGAFAVPFTSFQPTPGRAPQASTSSAQAVAPAVAVVNDSNANANVNTKARTTAHVHRVQVSVDSDSEEDDMIAAARYSRAASPPDSYYGRSESVTSSTSTSMSVGPDAEVKIKIKVDENIDMDMDSEDLKAAATVPRSASQGRPPPPAFVKKEIKEEHMGVLTPSPIAFSVRAIDPSKGSVRRPEPSISSSTPESPFITFEPVVPVDISGSSKGSVRPGPSISNSTPESPFITFEPAASVDIAGNYLYSSSNKGKGKSKVLDAADISGTSTLATPRQTPTMGFVISAASALVLDSEDGDGERDQDQWDDCDLVPVSPAQKRLKDSVKVETIDVLDISD